MTRHESLYSICSQLIQVLWKSSPLPSDASHVVIATGSIHPEMLSPPGSPVTQEISQPKRSFCGGTSLAPLRSGRSQSSRARAVAKALQIISETKHHGKFRKPKNRIYEEVDINGPIPKRRPKPACQGSMEHRKALSLR